MLPLLIIIVSIYYGYSLLSSFPKRILKNKHILFLSKNEKYHDPKKAYLDLYNGLEKIKREHEKLREIEKKKKEQQNEEKEKQGLNLTKIREEIKKDNEIYNEEDFENPFWYEV